MSKSDICGDAHSILLLIQKVAVVTVFWPYFRLAEIYLDYAEACNEKPERNETEALKYINLVRERSGLNALETAYPEVKGNKDLLRMLIQKERMVELAFEGHRYYDARRWMIAQQEFPGPEYSLNLLATSYEDSWSRTSNVWKGGPGYLSLSIISSLSIKNN